MKDAFENSFSILTGEVKKLVGLQQINNEGQRNFELSADRGVLKMAMEPQYGGDPL